MADQGTPDDGPSLEMPSLPFWRRKRLSQASDDTVEAAPAPRTEAPTAPLPVTRTERPAPAEPPPDERWADPEDRRSRRTLRPPALSGATAALATGAAVGALGVLLVWLASVGCEAARGTASCGDGPGFLVLTAVLVLLAYLGGMLLRGFGVPDAGSTSLLAVGVMAVLVLVLLTDSLFEWWMALAVPVVSAIAYALSWWVSTRAVATHHDEAPTRL